MGAHGEALANAPPWPSTAGHTKPVDAEDCQLPAHLASVDTLDHGSHALLTMRHEQRTAAS